MVFTYYQKYWVKFVKCKNLLVLKLVPFLHLAFTHYSSYFQALIFQNLCNSIKVEHFFKIFAARQHAYLSPIKFKFVFQRHGPRNMSHSKLSFAPLTYKRKYAWPLYPALP